jgi:hypothetical protein
MVRYDKKLAEDPHFATRRTAVRHWCRLKALWFSVTEGFPPALYYIAYLIICVVAQTTYPPLCALLLLDIVVKSETTARVFKKKTI